MQHAYPHWGLIYLSKHDVKDGFYHLFLLRIVLKLSIFIPQHKDEEPLVAIPISFTMGWVESLLSFCTISKTITHVANARFQAAPTTCPQHHLSMAENNLCGSKPLPWSQFNLTTKERPATIAKHPDEATLDDNALLSNRPHQHPVRATDVHMEDSG